MEKKGDHMAKKLREYRHGLLLLYFPFYLWAFTCLEKRTPEKIHIINCALDNYIPFIEVFIIPYLLWFAYCIFFGLYFFFKEKETFCRMMYVGMIGMTLFVIVSYLYPNGLTLRPETFARDNIFVRLVQFIYATDTPTNVLPSIHVFNSMGIMFTVKNSETLKDNALAQWGSVILTTLIVLSTMFLKQHSIIDVMTGMTLACVTCDFVYNARMAKLRESMEERKQRRQRRRFPKSRGKRLDVKG